MDRQGTEREDTQPLIDRVVERGNREKNRREEGGESQEEQYKENREQMDRRARPGLRDKGETGSEGRRESGGVD